MVARTFCLALCNPRIFPRPCEPAYWYSLVRWVAMVASTLVTMSNSIVTQKRSQTAFILPTATYSAISQARRGFPVRLYASALILLHELVAILTLSWVDTSMSFSMTRPDGVKMWTWDREVKEMPGEQPMHPGALQHLKRVVRDAVLCGATLRDTRTETARHPHSVRMRKLCHLGPPSVYCSGSLWMDEQIPGTKMDEIILACTRAIFRNSGGYTLEHAIHPSTLNLKCHVVMQGGLFPRIPECVFLAIFCIYLFETNTEW